MTAINITSVQVLNNEGPSTFRDDLQFEISYECLFSLQHGAHPLVVPKHQPSRRLCIIRAPCADLEWKMTWVGSADTEKFDQVLDSVLVGPVVPGSYRFIFAVRAQLYSSLCAAAERD